jgi:DNA-directed RNA polymerase subunit RPC12/RpoP
MATITIEQIMEAIESGDYVGFCLNCGAETCGVEPDARKYKCDECGASKVYGAEELLLMAVA